MHRPSLPRPARLRLGAWAAGLLVSAAAFAQTGPIALDLPAQPLAQALQALARQSGAQIVFPTELAQGRQAPALKGSMPVAEALQRLVAGSGLVVQAQDARTFTLERAAPATPPASAAAPLPQVTVVAQADALPAVHAGGQVARGGRVGLLGNLDNLETPFNVSRYTSELIENQQARSLLDVMDNDPSVRASAQRDAENTTIMVRGFEMWGREIMVDGMAGMSDTRGTMIEAVERIEVHRGPSAMLNGVSPWGSSWGGSVNYVLKRATDEPITRLTASYASASQLGGHLDLGRRFGPDKSFGIRLNTAYRDGHTDVDHTNNRSAMGALSLDWRGERVRLFADLTYQDRVLRGGWGSTRIGSSVAIPSAPDASLNSKQPWEFFDGQNQSAMLRAEVDIAPRWTLSGAWGKNHSDEVYLLVIDSINNVNGNKTGTPFWIPARSENESAEIALKGQFETGAVKHSLAVVANRNEAGRGQLNWSVPGCGSNCAPSNIYQPIYYAAPDTSSLNTDGIRMTTQYENSSIAVADHMKLLDDRLILLLGARHQKIASNNYVYATMAPLPGYARQRVSPSVGAVFKLQPRLAVYASYIESLNSGGSASSYYENAGDIFAPYVTRQIETGVKYERDGLGLTASLFQVSVPSAFEVPATAPDRKPTLVYDGLQRHRGLEFNVYGQPARGLRLLGGLMLLDAEMVKTENGTNDGKRARGAPHTNLNLGAEWDVRALPGFTLSGRAIYTSRENLDLSGREDRRIPSWTRFDLGARYAFKADGKPVTLRMNIDNLFDRSYWAAASRGVLTMGSPRSVRLSATMDF